ncbi:hypothetical protein [Alteraurantiacibacter aquimixticola]|uniref:Uncharacterized protein n=1 Tax=Alteraurantiacibacter aquimixticola TaxID=2489173 RepID=A0A4T3F3R7_9SPHN|nr:hypothetical protein [Alteraurantiacibacter aquimixticola]TIX50158.1 hypothetical protein E5222_07640 [Alteraurantiacibacter aquimixticola]
MTDDKDPIDRTILVDAVEEAKEMGREGMSHPSTKPVLTGAAVGAVAGAILPMISWPVGLAAGAAFMLYKRVRP